jgi:thioredoxin 1
MKKALLLTALLSLAFPITSFAQTREAGQTQGSQYEPGKVYVITEQEFATITEHGNVVVDFYADWCNPCRRLAPLLDKLAAENPHILFVKINFDGARSLSDKFKVRGIPTLILFKDGVKVEQTAGLLSKDQYTDLFDRVFTK